MVKTLDEEGYKGLSNLSPKPGMDINNIDIAMRDRVSSYGKEAEEKVMNYFNGTDDKDTTMGDLLNDSNPDVAAFVAAMSTLESYIDIDGYINP